MRLLGCFGDSLLRKFGDEPPQEWVSVIADLRDYQLERGMRRLLGQGKPHPPSLPEFRRICLEASNDREDSGPALPAPDNFSGDTWAVLANQHLLGFITRKLKSNPAALGSVKPYAFSGDCFSAEQARATAILVAYKNAWARDMREFGSLPTPQQQKSYWDDCMRRAMGEINPLERAA